MLQNAFPKFNPKKPMEFFIIPKYNTADRINCKSKGNNWNQD